MGRLNSISLTFSAAVAISQVAEVSDDRLAAYEALAVEKVKGQFL
jgi:hypothetical protein